MAKKKTSDKEIIKNLRLDLAEKVAHLEEALALYKQARDENYKNLQNVQETFKNLHKIVAFYGNFDNVEGLMEKARDLRKRHDEHAITALERHNTIERLDRIIRASVEDPTLGNEKN